MELTNQFSVNVPVDEAWTVLTDLERIAPCMPGAELRDVDGDDYGGVIKVKVGPMVARYAGRASFVERDEVNHRAVLRAEGRDTRGQGNAAATITATLEPEGTGTHVTVHTDLTIAGKVAQFGRGALADVSNKLLAQFVQALEADLLAEAATGGGAATGDTVPPAGDAPTPGDRPQGTQNMQGVRRIHSAATEPIDLLATARSSMITRAGPLAVLALVVALWLLRRR